MNELLRTIYEDVSQREDWEDTKEAENFYDRVIVPNLKKRPELDNDYWGAIAVEKRYGFEAGFYAALELMMSRKEVLSCGK